MKIGLLGFGVVGRGVYDLTADREDIQVAKVVCLEDITLPDAEVTKDFQSVLNDPQIDTVVEAMACGIPCIGFNVGGIPEMIDHLHNGYVAECKNVHDFSEGIHWLLIEGDYELLSREASRKAANTYGENSIAMKYIGIYNSLTGRHD